MLEFALQNKKKKPKKKENGLKIRFNRLWTIFN